MVPLTSERASELSPTYLAMSMRKQWSDEHLFEESPNYSRCARCYMPYRHPFHVSREDDKAAVMRWRARFIALHGE